MHPHGVTYTPPNDGPWYAQDPHKPGAAVKPDETYTYEWRAVPSSVDTQVFGPATTLTVEYTEDNPGTWLYHCHVTDRMAGGMVGFYEVARCPRRRAGSIATRRPTAGVPARMWR